MALHISQCVLLCSRHNLDVDDVDVLATKPSKVHFQNRRKAFPRVGGCRSDRSKSSPPNWRLGPSCTALLPGDGRVEVGWIWLNIKLNQFGSDQFSAFTIFQKCLELGLVGIVIGRHYMTTCNLHMVGIPATNLTSSSGDSNSIIMATWGWSSFPPGSNTIVTSYPCQVVSWNCVSQHFL